MKKTLICLTALLVWLQPNHAQVADTVLFSPQQLREDADYFFSTLEWAHPDLYYFCGKEAFEEKKRDIYRQLDLPMTREEFVMTLSAINPCLDDHSAIGVFVQPHLFRWVDSVRGRGAIIFPRVYVKGDQLFTDIDGKREELLSVNGVAVRDILAFMRQYQRRTPVRRNDVLLEGNFAIWAYTFFDIRHPFEITYKKNNWFGGVRKKSLPGVTFDDFKRFSILYAVESADSLLRYAVYPSSSVAVLTVSTFDNKNLKPIGYKEKLNAFFDIIRRNDIRRLFIDVKYNEGGNRNTMEMFFDYLQHDTLYFKHSGVDWDPTTNAHPVRPYQNEVIRLPNRDGFNGQLYVIMGPTTCSVGAYFCHIVSQNKLGVLIGQNTGTFTRDITFVKSCQTPLTGIWFDVATRVVDVSHDTPGESLAPDLWWKVEDTREFTEEELNNITKRWDEQKTNHLKIRKQ